MDDAYLVASASARQTVSDSRERKATDVVRGFANARDEASRDLDHAARTGVDTGSTDNRPDARELATVGRADKGRVLDDQITRRCIDHNVGQLQQHARRRRLGRGYHSGCRTCDRSLQLAVDVPVKQLSTGDEHVSPALVCVSSVPFSEVLVAAEPETAPNIASVAAPSATVKTDRRRSECE